MTSTIISFTLVLLYVCCVAALRTPFTETEWAIAADKAKTFVSALTLEEKVVLATGTGWQNGPCVGNIGNISRMGFKGLCLQDAPAGVRYTDGNSVFPAAISAAATWNRTLIYQRGVALGEEFKGKGIHVALGPMMNIARAPAGGRNWEGFGADPYLQGVMAYESVLGIQDTGVIACAKHYIGNEQENNRESVSSNIDERAMHEIYQWPFMRAVQAGVGSVMCAYNKVNGTYSCQHDRLLNQILKAKFGFRGFVMSDWVATMSTSPSANAGLDMNMPGNQNWGSSNSYWGATLVTAVKNKQVPEARVTDMAIRIMTAFYLLKQDEGFPAVNFDSWDLSKGKKVNVQGDHAAIIRKIGADSTVLLKNTGGVLPFTTSFPQNGANYTFAVIGDDAGPNPGGINSCDDRGCDKGTLGIGWGSGTANYPYLITPVAGIKARATINSQTVTSYLFDTNYAQAQNVASSASIAIVFVNANSGEEYITVEGNRGDRKDLSLWHGTDGLITAVANVSKTVVVIHSVGPVNMPWLNHPNVSAVIMAGLPGQESGNAIADILFGDVNPSGKLVYTIGKARTDYPADILYGSPASVVYNEGIFVDYRWFDAKNIVPNFEFGFGLSYTTFSYSNLVITPVNGLGYFNRIGTLPVEETLWTVSVDIQNTGSRSGEEVAQLYLSFPPSANEPPKILRGFDKVWVGGGGGTATAKFGLTYLEIAIYDVATAAWTVPRGTFTVAVGASSRDIKLVGTFTV